MSGSNLWGDLSTLKMIRTPKTILIEQADILNQATGGVIRAQIGTSQSGDTLNYSLMVVAPALNNYSYTITYITHDINIYPCKLYDPATSQWAVCQNEADLNQKLGALLGGEKTRRVIESLLSQSRA